MAERSETDLRKMVKNHRRVLWVWRHWLHIALAMLLFYVGLSLLPPVLMKAGLEGPAKVIYTIYSPMCHQFAFRSWFFFGDQYAYPLEAADSDLKSFEQYAAQDPHFDGVDLSRWSADLQVAARSFHGNEDMGYKTALCERDVAIYAAMFLAGIVFSRLRGRLRPASIWLYLVLGIMPIGLDGFSQLLSYPPFEYWPVRETLPAYRVLSGGLFGIMNIWLAFPYLESSMHEAIESIEKKVASVEQRLAHL